MLGRTRFAFENSQNDGDLELEEEKVEEEIEFGRADNSRASEEWGMTKTK